MRSTALDITSVATDLVAHLERTWNEADGAAFGEVFTEDCDFVDIRGAHHQGRAEVVAGHQALFDFLYRDSTVRYRLDTARQVAPSCVVAVMSGTLDVPGGPAQGVRHCTISLTLVEDDGVWAAAGFQNTEVLAG